jgi:hypothetical protein
MCETHSCQSALIDVCTEFLLYLEDLREKGLISKAEYENHSMMKIKFLNSIRESQVV